MAHPSSFLTLQTMRIIPLNRRNEAFVKDCVALFCWILKFDSVHIVSITLFEETFEVLIVSENIFTFMAYIYNHHTYLYCYECKYSFNVRWNTCEHVQKYFC